ncbi:MAG: hypothetical protein WCV43_06695 [Candidatus Caldatribacteriota bacterium]|jgi:hypothetical protein
MFLLNENFIAPSEGATELLETSSVGYRMPKARIKTVLQTLNEVNKNKRVYPKYILEKSLNEIRPIIKSRSLLGELDHPLVTGNDEADSYRHFVVLYEKASHIFEDIYIENNVVYGIVETSLTDPGFKMAGLIMDKVPVGFSLRAIGESKVRPDGVTEVSNPFNIITYDCVSNPSHAKARMVEVVSENFNKFREDTIPNVYLENDVIFDRSDLLRNTFNIKIPTGNLEQIVESLEKKLKSKRFTEADATVDEMVQGYVGDLPEYQTPEVINFLDEYINAKAPVEDIFEKYLKS